jgi:iron complex outermembrane recepter protein
MFKLFTTIFFVTITIFSNAQIRKDSLITAKVMPATTSSILLPRKLEEVQVTAIRGTKKAPFTKTTFDGLSGSLNNIGQDIPYTLQYLPSVISNSDAGNGVGYTGIRIRGTDATRINMTINGVPYNDAESQGLFFVNLPDFTSSVSSLEVQRGVGSSSNGAGAFGATMSFSTNNFNEKAYVEWNNSYGSFGTYKNTLKFGTGLHQKMYFDARLSQIKSKGYIDRATSNLQSAMATIGYVNKKTDVKFNAILGKEKTYQAWYGVDEATLLTNRTYNSAGTEKAGTPYDNETDNYKQNHLQLIWNQKINKYFKFSTTSFYTIGNGFYEQYKADQKFSNYGLPNVSPTITKTDLIRQLWLDNDFYGQTFAAIYAKAKSNIAVGGMISKYVGNHFGQIPWAAKGIINNYKYYEVDAFKKDRNMYAKWQYDVDSKVSIYTDVQYRNVQYTINGFKNNPSLKISKKYNFTNPKFGLSYNDYKTTASLSYARAAKEPNREDFEANASQLPIAEKLNDVECNFTRKLSSKIKTAATVYYMQYKDQLILTGKINDVGAYTRQNVPNSYRTGVELQASYDYNFKFGVSGNISVSKNKVKTFTEYMDNYDNGTQKEIVHSNTNIAYSPSLVAAICAYAKISEHLFFTLNNKFVSKQYLDNTQNENRMLKSYLLQDVLISYNPTIRHLKKANFVLQINNLFNKKYEPNGYSFSYISSGVSNTENYYFPMAGINFMLGVNLLLQK